MCHYQNGRAKGVLPVDSYLPSLLHADFLDPLSQVAQHLPVTLSEILSQENTGGKQQLILLSKALI